MAKIDVTREELGYLKLWLGVVVVSDISLISWLVTRAGGAGIVSVVAAWAGVVVLGSIAVSLHIRITELIQELEEL
ncbi:MAG: hypothetical protein L0228_19000 [Planctomycetes bacterium]|nr:hypothetical protein [Planctomycetota bacterium]